MGGKYVMKVALFFRFGHQGASLFSNSKFKLAVLSVSRGEIAKIRPFFLCKWGVFICNERGLSFLFRPPVGEFI